MRAGLYQRVSDDAGGRSRSVKQQNEAGRAAAVALSWKIVDTYNEPDRSASRFATRSRPVWEKLRADVRAKRLDVVVLWEPSRGSRELEDWAGFLNDCRRARCCVYVVSHSHLYDPAIGRDWRSLAEDGVDSAYESEKISTRTRRGLADARERGIAIGRVPYGYARTYDPVTREGEQLPGEHADVVAAIVARIASGSPISSVRQWLHETGVASPLGAEWWNRRSITDMVKNRAYLGQYPDGRAGAWPALVGDDVFARANAVLAGNVRTGARPGRAAYLCSYILNCHCGAPLAVKWRKPTAASPSGLWYRCYDGRAGCDVMALDVLDRAVGRAVVAFVSQQHVYAEIMRADDVDRDGLEDQIAAERQRLADVEAAVIAGTVSADSFARVAAGIEQRIADLSASLEPDDVAPVLRDLAASANRSIMAAMWAGLPLASQRAALRRLCASDVFMAFVTA